MSPLHFSGWADAYLEWAVATDFAWVGHATGQRVSVLVDNPTTVSVAAASTSVQCQQVTEQDLRRGVAGLPQGVWFELAQAVDDDPAINPPHSPWPSTQNRVAGEPVALACIDSGIGRSWLADWQYAHPARRVCHWDMDAPGWGVQRQVSHGAHVLSWLAGQPPYAGYHFESDTASHCPLILVNLPRDAVEDPTGRWLGRYILDGLDFAIAQAQAWRVQRLVVNMSWGPQTGPHDGSSLLERALAERVQVAAAAGLQVDVVLAAGNSRESRAHAQFAARTGCPELVWAVPPASRVPFFLELWWPAGTALDQVRVEVTAPNGRTLCLDGVHGAGVTRSHSAVGVLLNHPQPQQASRPMALLALDPTATHTAHGRWRLRVAGLQQADAAHLVHVYVARQLTNLGGRYRGPDSYLDVPPSQPREPRYPRPSPGVPVTAAGTLSGLATATSPCVHVAGGWMLSTREPARYASEGPAVAGLPRPDWALPTDETPLLRGLLGAGTRPGSVVRLVGTSMAAPQLARWLVNGMHLPPLGVHNPRTGYDLLHLGWTSRQRV
ncbi:MAG: hypothetical protein RLZZ352_1678 [Pseudomonadota bacterium]